MPVTLDHMYELDDNPRMLNVKGYCYYSPKRELEEQQSFYVQLHEAVEKLQSSTSNNWKKPETVAREITRGFYKYIDWKFQDGKFEVSIKQKALAQRVNRMGKFIIFYNGELDWMECLIQYRQRDAVEKCFLRMKKDLDVMPMNVRTEATVRGYLFMVFIALIIRMRLQTLMKENELLKKYSVEKLLLELEKIKLFELSSGEVMLSEVSKKNREILKAFNICA